jgi:hypothetical protein
MPVHSFVCPPCVNLRPAEIRRHHPSLQRQSVVGRKWVPVLDRPPGGAWRTHGYVLARVPHHKVGVFPRGNGALGSQADHGGRGGAPHICDGKVDGRKGV